jgi:4-diphosphocytidyl-2-C-methyl-D-erythritol kinase
MSAFRSARVIAQGKINLFLRILAREASGYHQLETLFCRLALGDEVTVRVGGTGRSLDVAGPALPANGLGAVEQNLAWRAAIAFSEAANWPTGFAIEIDKWIPVGGGLGGGSADAGAVLRCLNALAPSPITDDALLAIASSLGADVPFMTQSRSALALGHGRGDQLLALAPLPPRGCDLAIPAFGVSTADAYRWLTESPAAPPVPELTTAASFLDWAEVDVRSFNEFERVVFPYHPSLRSIAETLADGSAQGAKALVRMSGSGSTIFALHPNSSAMPEAADSIERRVTARHPGTRIYRSSTASSV